MLEIKGKVNTAICFASIIEDEAIAQIKRMCDYELASGSQIRIMPDVHAGKGCTIGTTMTITNKVCPNIVGVDLGCGMYTIKLADVLLDYEAIDAACHYIPSGTHVWESRQESFPLTDLGCYKYLKNISRLEQSLGTLGSGNHFIEIDRSTDGSYYLIIHTGSRNLGKQVAEIYQNIAINLQKGQDEYIKKKKDLILTYKTAGKQKEIQNALKALENDYKNKNILIPEDLCWLYGQHLEDYLHDVEICQRFACRNREKIAEIILEKSGLTAMESFHTIHNYIDTNEKILRKGAIAAHEGEQVLIPINMRDGSILAMGKGNPQWNYSAPHGAGRLMSRSKAKESLDMAEYKNAMKDIYTTSVSLETIDEAPMAYKSKADIIDDVRDSVDIIDVMTPVYNFKK